MEEREIDDPLVRYRDEVRDVFSELSPKGLPETNQNICRLRLDQIFIRLCFHTRRKPPKFKPPHSISSEIPQDEVGGEDDRSAEVSMEDILRSIRGIISGEPERERIDVAKAIAESGHLVILGDPGSGKTTLTRWLAVTFAENRQGDSDRLGQEFKQARLPILIELRRLMHWIDKPETWPGEGNIIPKLAQFIADDPRFHGDIKQSIQTELTRGGCLLLFDGLDEVADQRLRRKLAESIQSLARDSSSKGNIIIVTSRPLGFENVELGPSFQICEVQPFSPEDIRLFLDQWYATAYGEASRAQAKALVKEIESQDRIAALATNPLLCSVIAIICRRSGHLTNRRADLYEECCKVLLETWDKARDVERRVVLEGLDWRSKLTLLAEVAYSMHSQGQEVVISRDKVIEWVKQPLAGLSTVGEAKAHSEAEKFVTAIEDQAGLIRGRGDGTLEFPHRTFQEYLAARHIAEQSGDAAIDLFVPNLNEAWWHEVHVLVLGILGGNGKDSQQLAKLINTVLNVYPKPWHVLRRIDRAGKLARWLLPTAQLERQITWFLGRELAIALQGYSDARAEARQPSVITRLTSEITEFVVRGLHGKSALDVILTIRGQFGLSLVVQGLLVGLENKDGSVRGKAAQALDRLAPSDPEVIKALLKALNDQDKVVRGRAAQALGRLASSDLEVIQALLKALNDQDSVVREATAGALRRLAPSDPKVTQALLKALNDQDKVVRGRAAQALGRLASSDLEVIQALLKALNDQDSVVREAAAGALRRLAPSDPKVTQALPKELNDQDSLVRGETAARLGRLAPSDPEVTQALIKELNDEHGLIRLRAVQALDQLAQSDPEVTQALLKALNDQDSFVREAAAGVLRRLAPADANVTQALFNALDDEHGLIRLRAVQALGRLGSSDPEVIKALLKALNDQDSFVRGATAEALHRLAPADPDVVKALLKAFNDQDSVVRGAASEVFGQIASSSSEVIKVLLNALKDEHGLIRLRAAEALNRLAPSDPEVIKALVKVLKDEHGLIRLRAVENLCRLGSSDPEVIKALLKALKDKDCFVCGAAAEHLGRLAPTDPKVIQALVKALNDREGSIRLDTAKALGKMAKHCRGEYFSYVLQALLFNINRRGDCGEGNILILTAKGRPLPAFSWRPLAERKKRNQFWSRVRIIAYIMSFVLLACIALALFENQLPKDSFLARMSTFFIILVPTFAALAQCYDSLKERL